MLGYQDLTRAFIQIFVCLFYCFKDSFTFKIPIEPLCMLPSSGGPGKYKTRSYFCRLLIHGHDCHCFELRNIQGRSTSFLIKIYYITSKQRLAFLTAPRKMVSFNQKYSEINPKPPAKTVEYLCKDSRYLYNFLSPRSYL